jgi:hypothetical protein
LQSSKQFDALHFAMTLPRNLALGWIVAACLAFGTQLLFLPSAQASSQAEARPQSQTTTPPIPATSATRAGTLPPRKRKKKVLPTPNCAPLATSSNSGPDDPTLLPKDCPPVKIVVRNGGASEPAIRLSGSNDDEQDYHRRETTEQLLQATGRNLQQLAQRQLDPAEKEMVDQIFRYNEQSRTATAAGDFELGHNFALKAHILSDELLNH